MPRFLLLLCALVALPVSLKAQGLPAFCEQVSQDQLRSTPRPYALHQTADHSSYCEGMLSNPIAETVDAAYGDFCIAQVPDKYFTPAPIKKGLHGGGWLTPPISPSGAT